MPGNATSRQINIRENDMDGTTFSTRKLALLALLTALAILFGYVESLIPVSFGVPGIKLGLSNLVILIVLLRFRAREALLVSAARVLVIGFLFGNLYSIAYGLAGTCLSILVMMLLLKANVFGLIGISAAGGAAHNIGQLLVAKLVLPSLPLLWYSPILLLVGLFTGAIIGALVYVIATRLFSAGLFQDGYTRIRNEE